MYDLSELESPFPMRSRLFKTIAQANTEYRKWAEKKLPVLDNPYPGMDLVFENSSYCLLDHNQEYIVYYLQWEPQNFLNRQTAYRTFIWSDPGTSQMRGYTSKVFMPHIFNKIEIIRTSREQIPGGVRFWTSALAESLGLGFHCYMASNIASEVILEKLSLDKYLEIDDRNMFWLKPSSSLFESDILISRTPLG